MSDDELAAKLTELHDCEDVERAHGEADNLVIAQLRALGFEKSADAWEGVPKWYS